jgi:hypothetical protein
MSAARNSAGKMWPRVRFGWNPGPSFAAFDFENPYAMFLCRVNPGLRSGAFRHREFFADRLRKRQRIAHA